MTMTDLDHLIDEIADRGRPVRSHSTFSGRGLMVVVAALTLAAVYLVYGFRGDVMALDASPILFITAGLMLMLGAAAGMSAVRMARPQVGAAPSSAPWLMAALMLVPLMVLIRVMAGTSPVDGLAVGQGLRCLMLGFVAGIGTIAFLLVWLRHGAPVAPERAAWMVGMAGGAVGSLAVTLECPADALAHLGIWHVAVVALSTVVARLVLPRYLRW